MNNERYNEIIEIICKHNGIEYKDLIKINNYQQYIYILLLILKKHNCNNGDKILKNFRFKSLNDYKNNIRKAEDKFFINRNFRDQYFKMEKIVEKKIK